MFCNYQLDLRKSQICPIRGRSDAIWMANLTSLTKTPLTFLQCHETFLERLYSILGFIQLIPQVLPPLPGSAAGLDLVVASAVPPAALAPSVTLASLPFVADGPAHSQERHQQ